MGREANSGSRSGEAEATLAVPGFAPDATSLAALGHWASFYGARACPVKTSNSETPPA